MKRALGKTPGANELNDIYIEHPPRMRGRQIGAARRLSVLTRTREEKKAGLLVRQGERARLHVPCKIERSNEGGSHSHTSQRSNRRLKQEHESRNEGSVTPLGGGGGGDGDSSGRRSEREREKERIGQRTFRQDLLDGDRVTAHDEHFPQVAVGLLRRVVDLGE